MKKFLSRVDTFILKNIYTRKLYHFVGGGVIIFALTHLTKVWFIVFGIVWFFVFWTITKRFTLTIISIIALLVISNSTFNTLGGTTIWLVGDGLSALVGSTLGKKKWLWNEQKSVVGSFAFMVGGILAVSFLLQVNNINRASTVWLLAFVPTLIGCILEATSNPKVAGIAIGDNSSVIIGCGLTFHALSTLLKVAP